MKLKMYCASTAGQASGPGMSSKVARLHGVVGTPANGDKVAVPSPNASVFRDGVGGASLDLTNLAKASHQEFEEGKVYVVEIREAGPKD